MKNLILNNDYKQFIKTIIFSDLWHNNFDNKPTRVLLTYSWKLRYFTDYAQQLEMESIGKGRIKILILIKRDRLFLEGLGPQLNIHIFNYCTKELPPFVQI